MRSRSAFACAVVALLVLAGCGGDDDDATSEDRPGVEDSESPTSISVATSAVPTPTAVEAVIEPERLTYTIESGDSMGGIANTFGVPLGALVAINDLDDPNVIQVGQEVIIPTDEEVEEWEAEQAAQAETQSETAEPTATDS